MASAITSSRSSFSSYFSLENTWHSLGIAVRRALFWLGTWISSTECREYLAYKQIRAFVHDDETSLTGARLEAFNATVKEVNALFDDTVIRRHLMRLSARRSDAAFQFYAAKTGMFKEFVRMHEVFELLCLKWDYGAGFDSKTRSFLQAHHSAIDIERRFLLAQAKESGEPLAIKALEYARYRDELNLSAALSTYTINLDETIEVLSKHQDKMPTAQQLEDALTFLIKHDIEDEGIKEMGRARFLYSSLSSKGNIKTLILALTVIKKQGILKATSIERLLPWLETQLATLSERQHTWLAQNFATHSDAILDRNIPFELWCFRNGP